MDEVQRDMKKIRSKKRMREEEREVDFSKFTDDVIARAVLRLWGFPGVIFLTASMPLYKPDFHISCRTSDAI